MNEITAVIDGLFTIVNFWLPGYIFLLSFRKLTVGRSDMGLQTNIFAVVISLLIRLCAEVLPALRGSAQVAQPYFVCAFYCLAGLVLALLLSLLYRSKRLGDRFASVFVKSLHDDMWSDIIDFRRGTMLHAVLKNGSRVFGGFHSIEEKGGDSWLCLDSYYIEDRDGKELANAEKRKNGALFVFRAADIERFEVEYCEEQR